AVRPGLRPRTRQGTEALPLQHHRAAAGLRPAPVHRPAADAGRVLRRLRKRRPGRTAAARPRQHDAEAPGPDQRTPGPRLARPRARPPAPPGGTPAQAVAAELTTPCVRITPPIAKRWKTLPFPGDDPAPQDGEQLEGRNRWSTPCPTG